MIIQTKENLQYDESLLNKNSIIYDIGALRGEFAIEMAKKGYRVIAFEPDPVGITTIPKHENIISVQKGIGYPSGKRRFYSFLPGSGANGLFLNEHEEKVHPHTLLEIDVITLQEAVDLYGTPDLLKINAEGAEVEMIMNSSNDLLKRIKQMSLSFHTFCGFITQEQEDECKNKLKSLGFNLICFQDTWHPVECRLPESYYAVLA